MPKEIIKKGAIFFLVAFIVSISFWVLIPNKSGQSFPDGGFWYCEDLQMQICFDREQDKYDTYVIIEKKKVNCQLSTDKGSVYFGVMYDDALMGAENYNTFFLGQFLSFDDKVLVIWDSNAGKEYVFKEEYNSLA